MKIIIENVDERDFNELANLARQGKIHTFYMTDEEERPQGEREFIEILSEYREDDYDTLPEYKGKPYYSIHYRENGEEFVGYGTYKVEVLSEYLRNYFFNADMRGKKNETY